MICFLAELYVSEMTHVSKLYTHLITTEQDPVCTSAKDRKFNEQPLTSPGWNPLLLTRIIYISSVVAVHQPIPS